MMLETISELSVFWWQQAGAGNQTSWIQKPRASGVDTNLLVCVSPIAGQGLDWCLPEDCHEATGGRTRQRGRGVSHKPCPKSVRFGCRFPPSVFFEG